MLYFITGNKNKFRELKEIIPGLTMLEIDLDEIQSLDPQIIIEHKLREAIKKKGGEFIIEDTSLYLDGLNGFPGPLIKWMLETIGNKGIYEIAKSFNNFGVTAKTVIGHADHTGKISCFEGSLKGNVVKPRGKTNFGWDTIFEPKGYKKTMAEMSLAEKNKISMRRNAATKLNDFLKGGK